MAGMFHGCEKLTSLPNISNWNMNNVKDIGAMFYNCSSLLSLPNLSKWNTNSIITLS